MITIDHIKGALFKFRNLKSDTLQLNTSASEPAHSPGLFHWNTTDEMPEIGMTGGVVSQQVGGEIFVPRRVQNKTGSDMTNGQLVYISGGSGTNAYITLANADSENTGRKTIGMLTEDIDNNKFGWVTTYGLVRDVDTDGMAVGAELFLDTTDGGYTTTMPEHPNLAVSIGTVFRAHQNEGIIMVRIVPPTMAKCVAGGDGVVYDDIQVSISNIRVPTSSAPTERLYNGGIGSGVTFPFLGFAVNDYLYFDMQTPHACLISSILESHIHYTTPTDGNGKKFKFQLDVIACPIAGSWAVPTGSPFTAERTMDSDDTNTQRYFDIAGIPAVNTTVSTLYKCKLTRIAASGDEYGGEVYVSFLDGHYQKDSLGSRSETSKD